MTLGHVGDELYQLLRGDLPNREMLSVNDHLRDCELCRDELVEVSLAHALLSSVSDLLTPEYRTANEAGSDLPPLGFLEGSSRTAARFEGDAPVARPAQRSKRSFERSGRRRDEARNVNDRATGPLAAGLPLAAGRFLGADLPYRVRPSIDAGGAEAAATDLAPAGATGDDRAGGVGAGSRAHRRRRTAVSPPRRIGRAHRAMYRSAVVAVALAVLVFVALLGLGPLQRSRPSNGGQILLSAALEPMQAAPNATGSVTVRADGEVTIATSNLSPAPADDYYEVWLVDPGRSKMLPLGILPSGGTGRFSFPADLWSGYRGVSISLQANGAPTSSGVDMLSTLAPKHHTAPPPRSAPSRPEKTKVRPPPVHHRQAHHQPPHHAPPHPPIAHTSPPSGAARQPRAVRSLLTSTERHLSTGQALQVDTASDSDAVDPASGLCRDRNGACSLRAAIEVANALRIAVTIRVPAGIYVLSLGPLVASDPAGLTIEGSSAARTVVTTEEGSDRILVVERDPARSTAGGGAVVSLTNLTMRDGTAPSTGPWAGEGGAVLVAGAADLLELSGVTISDSRAAVAGGGLYARGQVWASAVTFKNDSAGASGGAAQFEQSEALITNSVFTGDSAGATGTRGGAGGAVDDEAAALVLVYSSFIDDSVTATSSQARGGALDVRGPAWLDADVFDQNDVAPASTVSRPVTEAGGALYVGAGPVTVEASTFQGNEAEGSAPYGGALFNVSTLTVISSRFIGNRAIASSPIAGTSDQAGASSEATTSVQSGSGGQSGTSSVAPASGQGGAVFDAGGLTVSKSWFFGNSSSGDGGTVFDGGPATITGSHFSRSIAGGRGGAIFEDGSLTLSDSTLSHGVALFGAGMFVKGSLEASGDAVVDNLATGTGAAGGGILIVGRVGSGHDRTLAVRRSTIAGNVAPAGAGIAEETGTGLAVSAVIARSFVSGNDLPSGVEQDCAAIGPGATLFLVSGGGNVVGDETCDLATRTDREGPGAEGYWLAASDGAVRACASAPTGLPGGKAFDGPVVAMAAAPGNDGYWEVTSRGDVDSFGSARWFGSAHGLLGDSRVIGFAVTLDGGGYWLVTSGGRVFNFGDAANYGSATGARIVAMARSVDGRGYWLLAADGDVRAFGDAPRIGSRTGLVAVAIASTPDGQGYWIASAHGAVHAFGDATNYGEASTNAVVAVLPSSDGRGYVLVNSQGHAVAFGDASWSGPANLFPVAAAAAT